MPRAGQWSTLLTCSLLVYKEVTGFRLKVLSAWGSFILIQWMVLILYSEELYASKARMVAHARNPNPEEVERGGQIELHVTQSLHGLQA